MKVTSAMVKELREQTGAGMMECKRALEAAGGDAALAADNLRKAGLAKAQKKAGRVAAEGLVVNQVAGDGRQAALVEINCETDFVAKQEAFRDFAAAVVAAVLESAPGDLEALAALPLADGQSVEDVRRGLVAKIGENIQVRRFARLEAPEQIGSYVHHDGKTGVLVGLRGGDAELAKGVAMHIAAADPTCVSADEVPEATLAKEREILTEQARKEGKPEAIVERMVEGRMAKFLSGITLLGQPYVRDPDLTVEKLLAAAGAEVSGFLRFVVGEGIEKKTENFAAEVMAQVRAADAEG